MAYTYDDFVKAANQSGLMGQFSQDDLNLAQKYPEFGLSVLSLKKDYNNAATAEQRLLANQAANELRKSYGNYSGGEQAEPAGGRSARADRQLRLVLLRRGADLRERLRAAAEGSAGPHPEPRGLLVEQGDGPAMEQLQEELSA